MLFRWIGKNRKATRTARRTQLRLEQLEDRCVPSATDLGVAGQFNAFVFTDYNGVNSDVEGRLAVGHDAKLTSYGVGDHLTNSHGTRDDLIVGHDLLYKYGQVFNGNIVDGHAATLTGVGVPHGTVKHGSPVDFNAALTDLETKSTNWSQFGSNGSVVNNWGGLVLTGSDPTFNVFNISANQLQGIWGLTINAPAGSTVLVNVTGTNVTMQNFGINVNGTDHSRVLFNLFQATNVNLSGIGFQGNILAPNAKVQFNNGSELGTLVAQSFTGSGQFNSSAININIPRFVPATISGTVFNDKNADGIQEPGELGMGNVTLILQGNGVAYFFSGPTDSNGNFHFTGIPPGNYTLAVVPPDGYSVVSVHVGTVSNTVDGTQDLPNGQILSITLGNNTNGINYNFGLNIPTGGGGPD